MKKKKKVNKSTNFNTITVRMPSSLFGLLSKVSKKREVKKSVIVREGIKLYAKSKEKRASL